MLGMAFMVQAQDEVIERPADVKNPKIDTWKNASFDLYDRIREIKANADSDDSYSPAEDLSSLTEEVILLFGKTAIMGKEALNGPKLKILKYQKSVRMSTKALKWCKDYVGSVVGADAVEGEEGDGK